MLACLPLVCGIGRHKNIDEKMLAASKCMEGLNFTLPVVIDGMVGAAEKAYTGRPAATAVVDLEGKIAFHSVGPRGAKPEEADKVIKRLIAKGGFPTTRPTTGPATRPTRRPTAGSTTRPAAKPTTRPATAVRE